LNKFMKKRTFLISTKEEKEKTKIFLWKCIRNLFQSQKYDAHFWEI
jgi:hypothetical protein